MIYFIWILENRNYYKTLIYSNWCPYLGSNIYINIYIYRLREVNCHHYKLVISPMHFVCVRLCLLYSKLESEGHSLWGNQYHGKIYSSRNLETLVCLSRRNIQYHDFSVFGFQYEDNTEESKRVGLFYW